MDTKEPRDLTEEEVADRLAAELDADIILYNGPIERPADTLLIDECITRRRRKNVLMVLVTTGGDADSAYRIARCLQRKYERFILYVSGYCKSAGTLVATGAHELVISDHGELGPLDVQMSKKDELWQMQSGLTIMDTLSALQDNALNAFENFFLEIMAKSGGTITLKTAAEISTEMTTGLFRPLYNQVDPLHIGEAGRAMSIAGRYGRRLLDHAENIGSRELDFIMSEYPSHGFVFAQTGLGFAGHGAPAVKPAGGTGRRHPRRGHCLDRQEATSLFKNVREPSGTEVLLAYKLGLPARLPDHTQIGEGVPFRFLSNEPSPTEDDDLEDKIEGTENARLGSTEGAELGDPAEAPRGKSEGRNGNGEAVPTPDTTPEGGDGAQGAT